MQAGAKFRPVENDKIINFTPTTNIEEIQDKEDIPKHGFNFSSIEVLSRRVGVDIYLSGMTLQFLRDKCSVLWDMPSKFMF